MSAVFEMPAFIQTNSERIKLRRSGRPLGVVYDLGYEEFLGSRARRSSSFDLWLREENGRYFTATSSTISAGL